MLIEIRDFQAQEQVPIATLPVPIVTLPVPIGRSFDSI
jgi:hypothetical protein